MRRILTLLVSLAVVTAVIAGLWAMVALSVLGDLFESLMKRQAGVKVKSAAELVAKLKEAGAI